uniref:Uncharacterized protein n=1 Tax=Nymphaea colorata TaxID=210225 RepID=A0A5K0YEU5_9MAGN|nr:unnamed protein product [Nymphaea colorata]
MIGRRQNSFFRSSTHPRWSSSPPSPCLASSSTFVEFFTPDYHSPWSAPRPPTLRQSISRLASIPRKLL